MKTEAENKKIWVVLDLDVESKRANLYVTINLKALERSLHADWDGGFLRPFNRKRYKSIKSWPESVVLGNRENSAWRRIYKYRGQLVREYYVIEEEKAGALLDYVQKRYRWLFYNIHSCFDNWASLVVGKWLTGRGVEGVVEVEAREIGSGIMGIVASYNRYNKIEKGEVYEWVESALFHGCYAWCYNMEGLNAIMEKITVLADGEKVDYSNPLFQRGCEILEIMQELREQKTDVPELAFKQTQANSETNKEQ